MNFICKSCGECCSNYLPLTENEIRLLKKLAKLENKHPLRQDWYDRCPFLNNQNRCDIYENRPLICREYTCYKFENGLYTDVFENKKHKLVNLREDIFGGQIK